MKDMKALDLFCGLGGWSDGLSLEGFEMKGVEIEPDIARLYKHKIVVNDVCELDGNDFKAKWGNTWSVFMLIALGGSIIADAYINYLCGHPFYPTLYTISFAFGVPFVAGYLLYKVYRQT